MSLLQDTWLLHLEKLIDLIVFLTNFILEYFVLLQNLCFFGLACLVLGTHCLKGDGKLGSCVRNFFFKTTVVLDYRQLLIE